MSYNGWTNRETWLVNVWFNPESKQDIDTAYNILEEEYDSIPDGVLKDMIDFNAINWEELRDSCTDSEEEEEEEE